MGAQGPMYLQIAHPYPRVGRNTWIDNPMGERLCVLLSKYLRFVESLSPWQSFISDAALSSDRDRPDARPCTGTRCRLGRDTWFPDGILVPAGESVRRGLLGFRPGDVVPLLVGLIAPQYGQLAGRWKDRQDMCGGAVD